MSSNKPNKVKSAGNFLGWTISVISGLFTLVEFLIPKGVNSSSLEAFGLESLTYLISLLNRWYVRYAIFGLFIAMILFFVFPREEEQVKKRRRNRSAKKSYPRFSNGSSGK